MRKILVRLALLSALAAIIPACGGSSGGSAPAMFGAAGILTMRANGGAGGATGTGGAGGTIAITAQNGGHAYIMKGTYSFSTAFAVPTTQVNLGVHPRTIVANTVVTHGAVRSLTVMQDSDTGLVADDLTFPATGLSIAAGVTLTLPATNAAAPTATATTLNFLNGIQISGTLTASPVEPAPNNSLTSLTFTASNFVLGQTGTISLNGLSPAAAVGGNGGSFMVTAAGTIINQGTINSRGGDGGTGVGSNGGNGGQVTLFAGYANYFTGTINTTGGAGTAGSAPVNGGNAGFVKIWTFGGGSVFDANLLTGTVTSNGGHGLTNGGTASATDTLTSNAGPIYNNLTVTAIGGNSTLSGNGGSCINTMYGFDAQGGQGLSNGSFTCRGGNGAGAAGVGGAGADVVFRNNSGSQPNNSSGIIVTTTMDIRGGNGAGSGNGGKGGNVTFISNTDGQRHDPGVDPFIIAGYVSIDSFGGDGGTGGAAGTVTINSNRSNDINGEGFVGSITIDVPINAFGGNGAAGNGGAGAAVTIATPTTNETPSRSVLNSGNINTSGGTGTAVGGSGAAVSITDEYSVTNTGNITMTGQPGGTGAGGTGGSYTIASDGTTSDTATIIASSGNSGGANAGPNGGSVLIDGRQSRHQGNITSVGGNAGGALTGGKGGNLKFSSWVPNVTSVSGTMTVTAGTGTPNGTPGMVMVDGFDIALSALGVVVF